MPSKTAWTSDDSRVLVVASGRGAYDQAHRFNVYHCQNRRFPRPARYIAFYSGGQIDTYAEIEGPPEKDVIIGNRPDLATLAREMPETNGDPFEPHLLFRLRNISAVGPIINDKLDKNGKRTAYTQSRAYTTIERLLKAKRTTQL